MSGMSGIESIDIIIRSWSFINAIKCPSLSRIGKTLAFTHDTVSAEALSVSIHPRVCCLAPFNLKRYIFILIPADSPL